MTSSSQAFTTSDPADIRRRLAYILRSSNDPVINEAWKRATAVSTGERLLDTVVRAVEMCQYAIDRSTEERHLDTAMLESSIRTILRDLDVRMMRKIPSGINVTISRATNTNVSYTVPAFTVWSGGGKSFYNRYPIRFNANETVIQARLYVGTIKSTSFISTGADFQQWISDEIGFTVSDGREVRDGVEYTDMSVSVSGIPISVSETEQWWDMVQSKDKAVKDRTTIEGRCQLIFGDSMYGYLPPRESVVKIQYVLTNGASDNVNNFTGTISVNGDGNKITAFPISSHVGTQTISPKIDGGADQVPYSTYRKTGPLLFASAGTVVRSNTAQAWAVNYPGVADALVLGQSRTNPNDRRYTNVLKACLLKGGTGIDPDDYIMSASEATGWLQHFNSRRANVSGYVSFYAPKPSSPPIHLILECASFVDLSLAEATATQAIKDLFAYGVETLRGTILYSQIVDSAKYSTEGITGIRSLTGLTDLVTYARPPSVWLKDEAKGSLISPGEYIFYVLATCTVYDGTNPTQEQSVPSNAIVYNATGDFNPTIAFNDVVGVQYYEVYCRFPGTDTYNRVATIPKGTYSYTLTKDVTPSPDLMATNQPLNFRFPKLGDLKIEAIYPSSEW